MLDMDLPTIPLRLGTALGLTHEPISFGIPGVVFLTICGTDSRTFVWALLKAEKLGEATKIGLLLVLAFVIGFALTHLGDALVGLLSRGLHSVERRLRSQGQALPRDFEYKLVEEAFQKKVPALAADLQKWTGPQAFENFQSAVLILLTYYTSVFPDLEEKWRRVVRNSNLLSGTVAALLLCGLLGALDALQTPRWLLVLGAVLATFGVTQIRLSTRYAARLIASGYLREK